VTTSPGGPSGPIYSTLAGQIPTGQAAVDLLLEVLDLEKLDDNVFRGVSPPIGPQRVYGGQVAGQALVAAGRTVDPSRTVHSLHGYFVRGGDPAEPITYSVENIRDGRSFSVRRAVAEQHGKVIFFMSASFQRAEKGLDHQIETPLEVPPPEEVPTMNERLARYPERLGVWGLIPRPMDVRYVGEPGWVRPGDRPIEARQRVWMRIDGKLPDDPLIHACALTFASDMTLLDAEPRSRALVSSTVPRRRVVPLRLQLAIGIRSPRLGERPHVHGRRDLDSQRSPGGPAAPNRRLIPKSPFPPRPG